MEGGRRTTDYGPRTTDHELRTLDFRLWALGFELLHIARVSPDREQAEEGAENVLAFGDPGDGFDVERVPGEEGGDEGAAPEGAGHAVQDGEKQKGIGEVKEEVGGMMAGGIEWEQLAIEHVGQPG